jgi:hypothetical protein
MFDWLCFGDAVPSNLRTQFISTLG